MRSEVFESQAYDIGAFAFSQRNLMFDVFPKLKSVMFASNRLLQLNNVINKGYIDKFPFSLHGIFSHSSITDLVKIVAGYMTTFKSREITDFRGWIVSQMGSSFYHKSGLKRYIERYFGLRDDEVSMEFAKDRMGYISDFRPEKILKKRLQKLTSQPINNSMDGCIQYPLLSPQKGFEEMFKVIEKSLTEQGCSISKNEKIINLRKLNRSYIVTTNKRSDEVFDFVLLAAPPKVVIDAMDIERTFIDVESFSLLSLFLKGKIGNEGDVIYNSSPYGRWKRITFFNRLYNEECEEDRFTVELVVRNSDSHMDINMAYEDFISSSEKLGISDSKIRLCGGTFTENAYPKLTIAQEKDIRTQREYLSNYGIVSLGRQGEYKYYSSNECVISVMEKFQQISASELQ